MGNLISKRRPEIIYILAFLNVSELSAYDIDRDSEALFVELISEGLVENYSGSKLRLTQNGRNILSDEYVRYRLMNYVYNDYAYYSTINEVFVPFGEGTGEEDYLDMRIPRILAKEEAVTAYLVAYDIFHNEYFKNTGHSKLNIEVRIANINRFVMRYLNDEEVRRYRFTVQTKL